MLAKKRQNNKIINLHDKTARFVYIQQDSCIYSKIHMYTPSFICIHQDSYIYSRIRAYITFIFTSRIVRFNINQTLYEYIPSSLTARFVRPRPGFNMADVMPNLEQFFESSLRTVHEAIEGLNCKYEPNRADSFESRLGDFVRTLDLMSSRFRACTAGSDRVSEDLQSLTNAVRLLQENYHSRNLHYQANTDEVGNSPLGRPCPVERRSRAAISRRLQGSFKSSAK